MERFLPQTSGLPRPSLMRPFARLLIALCSLFVLASSSNLAASGAWDGGGPDDNWTTGLNWSDNLAPANNGTADIYFIGSTRTSPNLDLDWSVASVRHDSSSNPFTLRSTSGRVLTTGQIGSFGTGIFGGDAVFTVDVALAPNSSGLRLFGTMRVNGPIQMGAAGQPLRLNGSSRISSSLVIAGNITGSGSLFVEGQKNQLVANSALTGNTTIGPDASLSVEGAAGALSATASINLSPAAILTIGDSGTISANPNRINDTATINSYAAAFTFIGSNNAITTREQIGTISLRQGDSTVAVRNAAAGRQTELVAEGINRAPGAALVLGDNLGQTGPSSTRFIVSGSAPDLVGGGGAAGTPQISIVPWIVGGGAAGDAGSTFVTYGAQGFRPLNAVTEYAPSSAAANPHDNVRISASEIVIASKVINSFVMDNNSTATILPTATLGINSGAVLMTNGGTISGGVVDFGSREGIIRATGATAQVASQITGSGGVTTSSAPGVTFSGANSYAGRTFINGKLTTSNNTGLGLGGVGHETVITPNSTLEISGPANNINESIHVPQDAAALITGTSLAFLKLNTPVTLNSNIAFTGSIDSTGVPGALYISDSAGAILNGTITSQTTGPGALQLRYETTSDVRSTFNSIVSDGSGVVALNLGAATSSGSGAIVVNSASTHTGGTTVGLGARVYFNNASGSGSGAGSVGADLGSVLGGVGVLDPADGGVVSISGGGFGGATLAPGDPVLNGGVGTLTIGSAGSDNSLFIRQGNAIQLQVGSISDMVRIFGGLQFFQQGIFPQSIRFLIADAGGAAAGTYRLITYTTNFTGPFSAASLTLPAGWTGTLVNNVAGQSIDLQLHSVPEPGSATLLIAAFVAFGCWRIRSRLTNHPVLAKS